LGKAKPHDTGRRLKKLARRHVRISVAPGAAPREVSALDALSIADEHRAQGRHARAAHVCKGLIAEGAAAMDARLILLRIAMQGRQVGAALQLAQELMEKPLPTEFAVELVAQALRNAARHEEAIELLTRAIGRMPRSTALREARALALGELGRNAEALAELRRVTAAEPERVSAYTKIAGLGELNAAERARLENIPVAPGREVDIAYSRACIARREGDIDGEMSWLEKAHEVLSQTDQWNLAVVQAEADALVSLFDASYLERQRKAVAAAVTGQEPIFIFGMPRSGSTLIQQVLISHPGVSAGAEMPAIEVALNDVLVPKYPEAGWPGVLDLMTADDFAAVRRRYLGEVSAVLGPGGRFVDKTLGFYRYAGLLALMFPEARFVHTLRHPLAIAVSCYQQCFPNIPFSHRLEDVATKYNEHLRLMNHWKKLFGDRVLTLRYEDVVADTETELRRLLDFCGLEWTDEVMAFHRSKQVVKTASIRQVRRPVYATSVDRWRRYEQYLGPARRALAATEAASR